jgi:hypothetical protein
MLAQEAYMRAYNRVMPFYKANCGLMPEIDRIVHNVKEKYAFICDSRVRGRPPELTIKFLAEHQTPLPVSAFQAHAAENALCAAHDPVSLDLTDSPEAPAEATPRQRQTWQLQSTLRRLAVSCYGAQGVKAARCSLTRAQSEKQLAALGSEAVATTAGEASPSTKTAQSAP